MNLPPFFRLQQFERIDSTNDEAKRLAEAGAPEGTFVLAQEQSAGRGRRGRAWVSPRGNFFGSLLLRPHGAPADAAQLGFATSLAVAEAAEHFLPRDRAVTCKWPNDVLIDGRKLAGILLESRGGTAIDWLVIGIGVNLVAHPERTDYPATSLTAAGRDAVDVAAFLPILAVRLLAWYEAWRAEGFAALREPWLARAHGLGGAIRARLPDTEIAGRFAGIDETGRLLLDAADGRRHIAAAEIFA
jgi:BirA family transcriptional regulator, biotin operon repressor / biotin---[acetyl-CoA-carboxylase] ligase